jgi:hypothetical protein
MNWRSLGRRAPVIRQWSEQDQLEIMAVQALDELASDLIRGCGLGTPEGMLDWLATSATQRVRHMARTLWVEHRLPGRLPASREIRCMVASWLYPQVALRYPQLADCVWLGKETPSEKPGTRIPGLVRVGSC